MIINKLDNVEINLEDGHKYALCDIKKGENIIKYGCPIGHAVSDIKKGEHIHTHNIKTNLSGNLEYTYNYKDYGIEDISSDLFFFGYVRENGDVGIRNEIWIVNTVGCVNKIAQKLAEKTVALINNFKDYYTRHNQVIYENPSPGNKAGGITTLEEKSLGCVQKGGLSKIVDVLDYGDTLTKNGLSLLNGPGNDIVAVTNLMAAGVHMILFTTGRGTPLGSAVPTVKISTNKKLYEKKRNWIDFDASPVLGENTMEELTDKLLQYVIEVASGRETNNEIYNYREISIFKDGVTL